MYTHNYQTALYFIFLPINFILLFYTNTNNFITLKFIVNSTPYYTFFSNEFMKTQQT